MWEGLCRYLNAKRRADRLPAVARPPLHQPLRRAPTRGRARCGVRRRRSPRRGRAQSGVNVVSIMEMHHLPALHPPLILGRDGRWSAWTIVRSHALPPCLRRLAHREQHDGIGTAPRRSAPRTHTRASRRSPRTRTGSAPNRRPHLRAAAAQTAVSSSRLDELAHVVAGAAEQLLERELERVRAGPTQPGAYHAKRHPSPSGCLRRAIVTERLRAYRKWVSDDRGIRVWTTALRAPMTSVRCPRNRSTSRGPQPTLPASTSRRSSMRRLGWRSRSRPSTVLPRRWSRPGSRRPSARRSNARGPRSTRCRASSCPASIAARRRCDVRSPSPSSSRRRARRPWRPSGRRSAGYGRGARAALRRRRDRRSRDRHRPAT